MRSATDRFQTRCSYIVRNLLVALMTPGPDEPSGEQLQRYLKLIVDDLLRLWKDGVRYRTPQYPQGIIFSHLTLKLRLQFRTAGRLVRVALVAIICDHPAMCKLCGFAEKNHKNAPCTKCKVPLSEMYSDEAIRNGKRYIIQSKFYGGGVNFSDVVDNRV